MPHRATVVAALASLSLLIWTPAAAQGVAATIQGRVVDETASPVDGATITAGNPATGVQRMTTTDDDGRFVLAGLPVEGMYDVRAEKAGFAIAVQSGIAVRPDQVLAIDFTLRVAAQDIIGVTAASAPLERADVSLRQTVDEDLIRALPVPRRGFLPLASLAAGLTGHPDFPNPHGQVFWTNNVIVDGVSHFSKWRSAARSFSSGIPLEAVRQVQVLTALFTAEFGEGLASITSVTTRAGTNEWHGSALLFGRHHALDAPPVFSRGKPSGNGQQYGFSLGGPLVANRSHLFASFEGRRSHERNIVVSPVAPNAQVPDHNNEQLLFARFDHQYGDRLLMARYNGERFRWHHEPGGLVVPGSGTGYATTAHAILLTAGLPLSPRTLHEPRFQFSRFVHNRRDLQPSVYVSQSGFSIAGGSLGPFGFDADPEDTWEARDTLSHSWRAHTVRAGGGIKYVRTHNTSLPFGRGAYFLAGTATAAAPYLFIQSLAPTPAAAVVEPRSLSGFVFAQTDWTLADLRMNLGLRYDIERISNVRGYDLRADINNVQPRAGVAWDVGGRGRTVVRGGFGVYVQQHLLHPINRVQLEGPDGAILLTLTPGSPLFPRFPATFTTVPAQLPPRDIHQVAPDFRNPYALQASGGVQRAFLGGIVSADYVLLDGNDLISLVDANAPATLAKPASRTVEQADATRPIRPVAGGVRKVITLGNEGRSWYHAVEVKFERSVGPLHTLASYTRSRAEDMVNYELPEDSRNLQAEKAPAAADVPHSIAAAFDWIVPGSRPLTRGWSVSGIGMFRSSRPYTISWGDDRNGTTQNDARPGGRNTGRTGPYRTIDVALTKRFRRGGTTIDARAQAFNALDATNYDQYVGELVSPLFGRPVSAFPSRQIELAAIVRF